MSQILAITIGSILGGLARYFLGGSLQRAAGHPVFPLGTLVVNLTGCFLIGLFSVLAETKGLRNETRLLLMTGFCGAFTTFSAFMLEIDGLTRADLLRAVLYVVASLVGGFLMFKFGVLAAKLS